MSSLRVSSSQQRMLDPEHRWVYPVDTSMKSRCLRIVNNHKSNNSRTKVCSSIKLNSRRCSTSSSRAVQSQQSCLRATAVDQELSLDSSGVSYQVLKEKLEAGEWEAADEETRRLLCVLAGEAAVRRKWVYFSEVKFIPVKDLQTLDSLWRSFSNNKFGYSVQRRIWKSVSGNWTQFFRKVGWTRALDDKNDTYLKFPVEFKWDVAEPTPDGHLPLTNALRGTQLLLEILSHPAFDEIEKQEGMMSKQESSSFF